MNVQERAQFLDAMKETGRLIQLTQAALARARSHATGSSTSRSTRMTRQVFELRAKSEWLRYAVLGASGLRCAAPARRAGRVRIAGSESIADSHDAATAAFRRRSGSRRGGESVLAGA